MSLLATMKLEETDESSGTAKDEGVPLPIPVKDDIPENSEPGLHR